MYYYQCVTVARVTQQKIERVSQQNALVAS